MARTLKKLDILPISFTVRPSEVRIHFIPNKRREWGKILSEADEMVNRGWRWGTYDPEGEFADLISENKIEIEVWSPDIVEVNTLDAGDGIIISSPVKSCEVTSKYGVIYDKIVCQKK